MSQLPTLFVSHGSPMLALDAGAVGAGWRRLVAELPRPRAIVVVSAHWAEAQPAVGSGALHRTIHDFYGFPAALYEQRYEPPGAPELAARIAQHLFGCGCPVRCDAFRGLDHGAWVPLQVMYPLADVPVVPLAINPRRDPSYHYRLGELLRPALGEDVLLLASGSLTHNLEDYAAAGERALEYVEAFQRWFFDRLQAGDLPALLDYRRQAPHAQRAHPTDEHLLPLYVALGAAGAGVGVHRQEASISHGALAMDSYRFDAAA